LKNAKKEEEAEKTAVNEPSPLNNTASVEEAPANVKQESLPRVVELKLFDLPPIAVSIPDAGSVEAEPGEAGQDLAALAEAKPENAEPVDAGPSDAISSDAAPDVSGADAAWLAPSDAGSMDNGEEAPGKTNPPGKPVKSKRGRKSLKQVAAEADLIEIPGDDILFSKQYYTMRAVAEMFRVNQSLLRFWETEFDILQPRKNKKGDRYFRPVDIKNLHLIYHLLRQRKYTIEGAKEFLKKNKKADERFEAIQRLQQLKAFLLEWKAQL